MTAATESGNGTHTTPRPAPDSRRWLGLTCISVAQLMVALDATVINIALPSAQRALAISDPQRQWLVTAYTLAFGGLVILGGRVADTIGRKRAFLLGLAGLRGRFGRGWRRAVLRRASWPRARSRVRARHCSHRPPCPCWR